jgi:hypothetical protein
LKIRPQFSDPQEYSPRRHCVYCLGELYEYDDGIAHDECLHNPEEENGSKTIDNEQ